MKKTLIILSLLITLAAQSQFYYNDLVDAVSVSGRMKTYIDNKVKTVTAIGYDPQGARSTDFNEWQEINANVLKITTRNGPVITRQYYMFDQMGRLNDIRDSSGTIQSNTTYTYNNNNITLIKRVVVDSLNDFSRTEEHLWEYDAANKPVKMWRVVDGKDSSEYRFTQDEKNNIGEEQQFRRNVGLEKVYYYYDESNRMTDIARYDKKLQKILPDFMFEYDTSDHVIQKITTLSMATRDYLIWRYLFNEKGLKTKEGLFNKKKEQTGKIEYGYGF